MASCGGKSGRPPCRSAHAKALATTNEMPSLTPCFRAKEPAKPRGELEPAATRGLYHGRPQELDEDAPLWCGPVPMSAIATRAGGFARGWLDHRILRGAARTLSDWIDLQWSLLMHALTRVAPEAHGRLLDVGCGDKPYLHLFRPYVVEYIGVEHEATFRQTAAQAQSSGPDVVYDGKTLPFEDGTFDTVLSVQVLEHTPDPRRLVSEMARVLTPGGVLILAAPFSFRLHEEPHDYFRYTPHGLTTLCQEAGLRVDRIERVGHLWSLLGHKLNSFLG